MPPPAAGAQPSTAVLRVAYLVNQYPKVSHSFIRREILALERLGVQVQRMAIRGWADDVVDAEDEQERSRTRYVLKLGAAALLKAVVKTLIDSPGRFLSALLLATRLGLRADRPLPLHWVYLAEACVIAGWLRSSGASHLHAHFGTNPAEVAMLVRVLGGPTYSFTAHGPEEFDKAAFIHLGEKIRRAAFVVAISAYGRSQLYRWVSHDHWHKVHVVHCGLEAAFHQGVPDATPSAHRLVCVGRLCEQKGQMLLIDAAQRLKAQGLHFELVLAGDGEMRAEIDRAIVRHGLAGIVRITGWISSDQVREEVLAARALVLPSFAEGLPVVLMEAMALGRPVLTTYVAGIPELVRDGRDGWLFPAGDVQALADAMRACLQADAETCRAMGAAARARALARHDIDTEALKLAGLFGTPRTDAAMEPAP